MRLPGALLMPSLHQSKNNSSVTVKGNPCYTNTIEPARLASMHGRCDKSIGRGLAQLVVRIASGNSETDFPMQAVLAIAKSGWPEKRDRAAGVVILLDGV